LNDSAEPRKTTDFIPGQEVEWRFVTRKGYGYSWWVPAVVVAVNTKKVTIDAKLQSGGTKRVAVFSKNLRPKPNESAAEAECEVRFSDYSEGCERSSK
jgi:hypothetical protein